MTTTTPNAIAALLSLRDAALADDEGATPSDSYNDLFDHVLDALKAAGIPHVRGMAPLEPLLPPTRTYTVSGTVHLAGGWTVDVRATDASEASTKAADLVEGWTIEQIMRDCQEVCASLIEGVEP